MTACTENVSPGKASSLYPAGTAHDHIPTPAGLISGITPQATGLPLAPDVTPISREVITPGTTIPGAEILNPASREAIISTPVQSIERVLPVPFAGNRDIATPGIPEPAIIQCTRSVRLAHAAPGTATGGLPGVRVIPAGLAATLEPPHGRNPRRAGSRIPLPDQVLPGQRAGPRSDGNPRRMALPARPDQQHSDPGRHHRF